MFDKEHQGGGSLNRLILSDIKIMKFNENPAIYNEEGKVKDPKIAEEMAYTEKPFREQKRWGIFGPSKDTIKKGEELAEKKATDVYVNLVAHEIKKNQEIREQVEREVTPEVKMRRETMKGVEEDIAYLFNSLKEVVQSDMTRGWPGGGGSGYAPIPPIRINVYGLRIELSDDIVFEKVESDKILHDNFLRSQEKKIEAEKLKINGVEIKLIELPDDELKGLSKLLHKKADLLRAQKKEEEIEEQVTKKLLQEEELVKKKNERLKKDEEEKSVHELLANISSNNE